MGANLSSLAPLKIGTTVLPVARYTFSPSIVAEIHQHSGQQYATAERISGANQRIIATVPLRAAYDLLGMTVLRATVVEAYLTKYSATTFLPDAGGTHPKLSLSASCFAACQIASIATDQDGIAMAEVEIVPLSNDGMTSPLAYAANGTLPTLAAQPTLHTLGPISINGTVYPGVTGVSLDLGQDLTAERHDGALYPIAAARRGGVPRLTVQHADPLALLGVSGVLGANITANVVQYLRQYNATTGVIDTGATAVSLTVAKGRAKPIDLSADQGAVATAGLEVVPISSDGATYPIAIATGATAPALP